MDFCWVVYSRTLIDIELVRSVSLVQGLRVFMLLALLLLTLALDDIHHSTTFGTILTSACTWLICVISHELLDLSGTHTLERESFAVLETQARLLRHRFHHQSSGA